jgi:hypothetical protein
MNEYSKKGIKSVFYSTPWLSRLAGMALVRKGAADPSFPLSMEIILKHRQAGYIRDTAAV